MERKQFISLYLAAALLVFSVVFVTVYNLNEYAYSQYREMTVVSKSFIPDRRGHGEITFCDEDYCTTKTYYIDEDLDEYRSLTVGEQTIVRVDTRDLVTKEGVTP